MNFVYSALIVMVAGLSGIQAKAVDIPLNKIEGRWGRDNCSWNIHTIAFTSNRQFLKFVDERNTYYYYVVGSTERGYKVVLLGEDRFDAGGNPVFWYIVFHDDKTFSWLRSDREPSDLRGPIVRCK